MNSASHLENYGHLYNISLYDKKKIKSGCSNWRRHLIQLCKESLTHADGFLQKTFALL